MRTYTGSTNCDDRATKGNNKGKIMVNLLENIRDPEEIERLNQQCVQNGMPPKYDLEKASMNIVYEQCRTYEEAFMTVFGDAMDHYNSQQKRSDRKTSLEKELEKLSKGKVEQELIHCMVAQVGNEDNHPDTAECVEILQEYLEQFRERFPNMRIINAAIHLDEVTPHLQIYFIPTKTKQQHEAMQTSKKWSGMDIQPSLKGALEQMGYDNSATVRVPKKDENGEVILGDDGQPELVEKHDYKNGAMAQWQKDFNGLLDEICRNHDIEIDHYMRGQKVTHHDTYDYYSGKTHAKIKQTKHELSKAEAQTQAAENKRDQLELQNDYLQEQLQEAQEDLQTVKEDKKAVEDDLEALQGKYNSLAEQAEATVARAVAAEAKANVAEARADAADKKADAAEARLAKAETAFSRLMERVAAWIEAHHSLERILRTAVRLSPVHREKIERRQEQAVERGGKALQGVQEQETVEAILAAENEMERGKRTFDALRTAAKQNVDPDDLEGMEL